MASYHITDNGPKPCSTTPDKCPITKETGDVHYSNKEEAQSAYEKKMDHLTFPKNSKTIQKIYAPAKPEIIEATREEAEEMLQRVKQHLIDNRNKSPKHKQAPLPKALDGNILAYGLDGSSMYNLHHGDSDRDLVILTDAPKDEAPVHQIFDDGSDVKIMTGFYIAQPFMNGVPNYVNLLKSGSMKLDKDNPYYSYLNSLRFNKYAYMNTIGEHLRSDLHVVAKRTEDNPRRADKSLKVILRNMVMAERLVKENNLRVPFTDKERETFYKTYDELINFKNNLVKDEKLSKEAVFNQLHYKVIELTRLNVK